MIKTVNLKKFLFSLLIPIAVGASAAFLIKDKTDIYLALNKPPLAPPPFLFGIVWTVLYVLIGISAYLAGEGNGKYKKAAFRLYYVSLVLNFLWPIVFFNLEAYTAALVILIVLWLMTLAVTGLFGLLNKKAGILMLPYLIWLTFAAYLNMGIIFLN